MVKNIITLTILLFSIGCGTIKSHELEPSIKQLESNNQDPFHIDSCGPRALEKVLFRLGDKHITRKKISESIQKREGWFRGFLSFFDHRARSITWPSEIKDQLISRGYKITKISNITDLKGEDTAIVLVHKKNTLDYHWMAFPVDVNIVKHFGSDTIIKMILLIKK